MSGLNEISMSLTLEKQYNCLFPLISFFMQQIQIESEKLDSNESLLRITELIECISTLMVASEEETYKKIENEKGNDPIATIFQNIIVKQFF